ncbi:MAG: RIP metalloprotease RseP [Oscillospiraceae bacterium]|nr:RIP metalloprotease RseP [Oscillospiraceae bacterium]
MAGVFSFVVKALVVILIFGAVILIHELGHFLTAKKCGIKVNEFAIGMGPRLLKFGKGETTYSLRAFPIGGFVSMEGEDEDSQDPRSFQRASVWKRILVTAAGAVMNFILGFLVLLILLSSMELLPSRMIADFTDDAVSNQGASPLKEGDEILSVNGRRCFILQDVYYEFTRIAGDSAEFVVKRDGENVVLPQVTFKIQEVTEAGNMIQQDFFIYGLQKTPLRVLGETCSWTMSYSRTIILSLMDLVTGRVPLNALSGPVGIVQAISEATDGGYQNVLSLLALFTINLGIFNLLPIPGLDGGHLLFLLIEAIRRKPIKQKYEAFIHMAGLALLMGLILLVTFWDITKLF